LYLHFSRQNIVFFFFGVYFQRSFNVFVRELSIAAAAAAAVAAAALVAHTPLSAGAYNPTLHRWSRLLFLFVSCFLIGSLSWRLIG
jgi:hypothetical protein